LALELKTGIFVMPLIEEKIGIGFADLMWTNVAPAA
jgi:hypothetical protein